MPNAQPTENNKAIACVSFTAQLSLHSSRGRECPATWLLHVWQRAKQDRRHPQTTLHNGALRSVSCTDFESPGSSQSGKCQSADNARKPRWILSRCTRSLNENGIAAHGHFLPGSAPLL
eukprot:3818048-Amphidinium_carterae.3